VKNAPATDALPWRYGRSLFGTERTHCRTGSQGSTWTALAAGYTTAALARVRAYNSDPVNRYRDGSAELNALGYACLVRIGSRRHSPCSS
jgi:hypothetical protein